MIGNREIGTLEQATEYTLEWASFSPFKKSELFMTLRVWADESYSKTKDECLVTIGGWLSSNKQIENFAHTWASVLLKYGVEYFHFREFADKKHKNSPKTVYDHLSDSDRATFLFELALAACELGIPVGGCHQLKKTAEQKAKKIAYYTLFEDVKLAHKARYESKGVIDFIFDTNDDQSWRWPLEDAWKEHIEKGAPFVGYDHKNDKTFTPLQAADLRMYSVRQNAERYFKQGNTPNIAQMLDLILEKNNYNYGNWRIPEKVWAHSMWEAIAYSRQWKTENPGKKYHPLIHCPLLEGK